MSNNQFSDDETSNSMFFVGRSGSRSNGKPPNGTFNPTPPAASTPQSYRGSPNSTNQISRLGPVGLSDATLSEARRRKLDAINRLQSLGAERDIEIPQIVVIGSQSAGKSSLIESISGITLPRASGTCTRCPTECRLIYSTDPWQCTVSLRFMTDETGKHYDSAKNTQFGPVIKNPREVEDRLRRAQRAILNPSTDHRQFLESAAPDTNSALNFSTNCVSLEIRGPEVTDLSFCDLPGLIASVGDNGRDEDVEEVKELVSSYIRKESCIILLTVACETDFETQGAYRLAKSCDPNGARTIGVLTKPDRIPEGDHATWMSLIKNEKSILKNGWYCVKQPSTAELAQGHTFADARRRGEDFFKSAPWSRLESKYQNRLGTYAVTQKLNEFLMDVISKRLPEIMQEVKTMLQKTEEELRSLPPRPTNDPALELMHLVNEFADDIHRQGEGFNQGASLSSEGSAEPRSNQFENIRTAHDAFLKKIRATAPRFSPDNSGQDTTPYLIIHPYFFMFNEGAIFESNQTPIELTVVVDKILKATTRELPGYFPFQVVQDLISYSTDQWKSPALALVDEIHRIVVEHQSNLIKSHFAKDRPDILYQTVKDIMHEYTEKRRREAVARVEWLLKLESNAFTLNKKLLDGYRQKFRSFYNKSSEQHPQAWNLNGSALEIMATVSAYFEVVHRRVLDSVPLAIDTELVRVQKRTLQDELLHGLKITDPEAHQHHQKLLAEPSEISERREELGKRYGRLKAAHVELQKV